MLQLKSKQHKEQVEIDEVVYELRSASAKAARERRNAMTSGASMEDGKILVGNAGNAIPVLVSECLYFNGNNVPLDVVLAMEDEIVLALHKRILEVSPSLLKADKEATDPKVLQKNGTPNSE